MSVGVSHYDGLRYGCVYYVIDVHVNGIEFPVVKTGQARLRVNLMPQHTRDQLDKFVEVFEYSLKKSNIIFEK